MPGKRARSDPRAGVRVTRGAVAVSTSRLSCERAGKTRTLMPVWDSSGESRQKGPPPVDAENSVRKFRNVWDRAVYCERRAATVLDADAKARAGDQKVNGSTRSGNYLLGS